MTTFDKRKDAAEGKFAHDEQSLFKAMSRRNKLVGLWAAEKMGLSGDAATAYAKDVVIADLEEKGDDDVVRKLKADFAAKNVDVSDHQIQRQLADMLIEAQKQLASE